MSFILETSRCRLDVRIRQAPHELEMRLTRVAVVDGRTFCGRLVPGMALTRCPLWLAHRFRFPILGTVTVMEMRCNVLDVFRVSWRIVIVVGDVIVSG